MKKNFLFFILIFCTSLFFAQTITGIWENQQRLIQFKEDSAEFVLKLFYGWYYDEAAVFAFYRQNQKGENQVVLNYSDWKTTQIYPYALINDGLYVDFYIRGSAFLQNQTETKKSGLTGFWRSGGNRYEITADIPQYKKEVYGYYFTEEYVYQIRYWLTDMPYEEVSATITDGDDILYADKYLQIGEHMYTCVTGRGTTIRNVQKTAYSASGENALQESKAVFSADNSVMSFSLPYLTRSNITDLPAEIEAKNARHKPPPKPPFEFMKLDFYWDEIKRLRKN